MKPQCYVKVMFLLRLATLQIVTAAGSRAHVISEYIQEHQLGEITTADGSGGHRLEPNLNHPTKAERKRRKKEAAASAAAVDGSYENHENHGLLADESTLKNNPAPTSAVVDDVDDVDATNTAPADEKGSILDTVSKKKHSILDAVSKKNHKIEQRRKNNAMREEQKENARFGEAEERGGSHGPGSGNSGIDVDGVDATSTAPADEKHSILDAVSKKNHKIEQRRKKNAMREEQKENARFDEAEERGGSHSPSSGNSGKSGKSKHATHSPSASHPTKSPSNIGTGRPTSSGRWSKSSKSKTYKSSKSGKSTTTRDMHGGWGTTHAPTPTSSPTDLTGSSTQNDSIAPTYIPPGAVYYDSFEKAAFPDLPEWSVKTVEDGTMLMTVNRDDSTGKRRRRRLEHEEKEPSIHWALTDLEAASGVYSIMSPDLSNNDRTPRSAYVTLATGDDWEAGYLTFSLLWDLNYPGANLIWYVDDGVYDWAPAKPTELWKTFRIYLEPGGHQVTWEYACNPEDYVNPPDAGVVFIDDVYFSTSEITSTPSLFPTAPTPSVGSVAPSTVAPTSTPTPARGGAPCTPLDPNPKSFEDGTFPLPPWSTGGAGDWALSTEEAFNGTASLKSPNLDGSEGPAVSNATLEVCDDFPGGVLQLQIISSVFPPLDLFTVYIDGEFAVELVAVNNWTEVPLGLVAGPHRIDFSYSYNMFGLNSLPPSPTQRKGAVWIDAVALVTAQI